MQDLKTGDSDSAATLSTSSVLPLPVFSSAAPSASPYLTQLLLWQMLDSSFPVGSFAHSNGLEAAVTTRVVRDRPSLQRFLLLSLHHTAASQLPTVRHAHLLVSPSPSSPPLSDDASSLSSLDEWYDSTVTSSLQRTSSRDLGQSFLSTFLSTHPHLSQPASRLLLSSLPHHHYPVIFSCCLSLLPLPLPVIAHAHLFLSLRCQLSAAVRLNLLGPREAQSLHAELTSHLLSLCAEWQHSGLQDSYGVHLIDLLCQSHTRLHTRLFVT